MSQVFRLTNCTELLADVNQMKKRNREKDISGLTSLIHPHRLPAAITTIPAKQTLVSWPGQPPSGDRTVFVSCCCCWRMGGGGLVSKGWVILLEDTGSKFSSLCLGWASTHAVVIMFPPSETLRGLLAFFCSVSHHPASWRSLPLTLLQERQIPKWD